jgi:hypothetical protein
MQEHERTLTDQKDLPSDDLPDARAQVWVLSHAHQNPLNDRLRRRAAVLVFMVISMAASAPKIFSGGFGPTVLWSGVMLVPVLLLGATLLTMRRRAKAGFRSIRRREPVTPRRGLESPATEG